MTDSGDLPKEPGFWLCRVHLPLEGPDDAMLEMVGEPPDLRPVIHRLRGASYFCPSVSLWPSDSDGLYEHRPATGRLPEQLSDGGPLPEGYRIRLGSRLVPLDSKEWFLTEE